MDKKEPLNTKDKETIDKGSTQYNPDNNESERPDETNPASPNFSMDSLREFLFRKLKIGPASEEDSDEDDECEGIDKIRCIDSFEDLIEFWKEHGFKNIITMVGAGISTSAGIPDFRSPDTGLYHNLQKYNLPHPMAIFELNFFKRNPKPFFQLAKELYPSKFKPTLCHYFIQMLHERGILKRHYTQNIDGLERRAGIPKEKIVEAHGTFYTNHCLDCRMEYSMQWMKQQIFNDVVPTCECNGIVKPDIVFFGENLPSDFYDLPENDFVDCDLLIVMGTSLEVQPFASLIEKVEKDCFRLLINREKVGHNPLTSWIYGGSFNFDAKKNKRDFALIGDCDDGILKIADKLGFKGSLLCKVKQEHKKLDLEFEKEALAEITGTETENENEGAISTSAGTEHPISAIDLQAETDDSDKLGN